MEITIYTDGACKGNPGPGGWAAILIAGKTEREISGAESDTTNNRMELQAVIEALKCLTRPCDIKLYTDSKYVCNAFLQNWISNWLKRGWTTSAGKPVKNKDLWEELISLTKPHNITWFWVKGHSGNKYNERCDELAVKAINDYLSCNDR